MNLVFGHRLGRRWRDFYIVPILEFGVWIDHAKIVVDAAGRQWRGETIDISGADPTAVPELAKDASAFLVNGVGDRLPSLDLLVIINPGCQLKSDSPFTDVCPFTDDEPGSSALAVVFLHNINRNAIFSGPCARQGRHDYPVWEDQIIDFQRIKVGSHIVSPGTFAMDWHEERSTGQVSIEST